MCVSENVCLCVCVCVDDMDVFVDEVCVCGGDVYNHVCIYITINY